MNKAFQQWSEDLADLISDNGDGILSAPCVICEEETIIECDMEDFDPTYHYCGRTLRCCP